MPERSPVRSSQPPANLVVRMNQLVTRVDHLARAVENLIELVRGQNELLERQYRQVSAAGAQPPAARLASEADPAGPSDTEGYADLVIRIRALVRSVVPSGSRVLVASKGDEELLLLDGRQGWHFPQMEGGVYRGSHPLDSDEAVAHLEMLRNRGADYFILPATAFWWLDYYPEFAFHLTERYPVVLRNEDACLIFNLLSEEA